MSVPEYPRPGALTPERVARMPAPGMNIPTSLAFAPDGRLTFLYSAEGTLVRQLYAWDPQTGERSLLLEPGEDGTYSREEALRRERQRQYGLGVTTYAWAEAGQTLLVPLGGAIYVRRERAGDLRKVADAPCTDPQLNPDGTAVAFVRHGELYVLDLVLPDAVPERLTFDATPAVDGDQRVTNGLAEFVAQEELGRQHGFWWSPDGRFLAFQQIDHEPVPRYPIVHQGEDTVEVETHRYPFAGAANVRWRLGLVRARGGAVTWLPVSSADGDVCGADAYLARVTWAPDHRLLVQLLSRNQRTLALLRVDPLSGSRETLIVERADDWLNLHDDLRIVRTPDAPPDDYMLLWSSERTGTRQLYLHNRDGRELRQLTPGPWPVDGVVAVDPRKRLVYFLGSEEPIERHLWRVSLDGGAPERLSRRAGMHTAIFSHDCRYYVEMYTSLDTPPEITFHDTEAATRADDTGRLVHAADRTEADALGLHPPEIVRVSARDGETLYGAIWRPPALEPGTRYPALVEVYGGPHVQLVANSWGLTVDLRAQYLASQGFVVFALDNRGSARRGHRFEAAIWRRLGTIEVMDQVDGARFLTSLPEVDGERIGVYGWSYGGYMTLMCLLKAPETFKAGVAGAPVTSWDGYDTAYTERYMETPQANPEGYREASALTHAARLRAPVLILHGLLDENVHFRHTARLIAALNASGKGYDLAIFPNERHGPRDPAQRAALERRIAAFFRAHLGGPRGGR